MDIRRHKNGMALLLYSCIVVTIALSCSFEIHADYIAMHVQTLQVFLGTLLASILVYRAYKARASFSASQVVVAITLGATILFGSMLSTKAPPPHLYSKLLFSEAYAIDSTLTAQFAILICWAGYSLLLLLLVREFYDLLPKLIARIKDNAHEIPRLTIPKTSAILLIAWLPYIIFFFPGCIASDTSRQMAIYFGTAGIEASNFFPWFVSVIYGSLFQIGCSFDPSGVLGIFFLTLFQAVLGALTLAAIIVWIQILQLHRCALGALIFFALFPIFPTYVVEIGKDTLHAYTLTIFTLQILLLGARHQQNIPKTKLISPLAIILVATLVALTRNNGIFLVIPALIVAALLYRQSMTILVSASTLTAFLLWNFILLPILGVAPGPAREALSMPVQIVASQVAQHAPISEKDLKLAEHYLGRTREDIAENYSPLNADPSKQYAQVEGFDEVKEFLGLSTRISTQAPLASIEAALITTHEAWYPFPKGLGSYHHEHLPYTSTDDEWTLLATWYPSHASEEYRDNKMNIGRYILTALRHMPPLSFLYVPGTYFWLMVLLAGYAAYTGKCRRIVFSVLSIFIMLEAVLIAAPVASLRYALPLVYSFPIFLVLFYLATPANSN